MKGSLGIRASDLGRNTILNIIGQGLPMVLAFAAMPWTIGGLGPERFGLLALAWSILGYFTVFDLGIGRAATKFVAESLGRDESDRLGSIIWSSLLVNVVVGLVGGGVLAALTPFLVERVLGVPVALLGEAKQTLLVLACALPIVMSSATIRGVLQASQRFDLLVCVQLPASSLSYLIPAVGALAGVGLPAIAAGLLVSRLLAGLAYAFFSVKVHPYLRRNLSFDAAMIRSLVAFGGWVTVSSVIGPMLSSIDRFLVGSLLTMSAVTYYTAPQEIALRLSIVPSSLVLTLFPAFSALDAAQTDDLERVYARAVKCLLLVMVPIVLLVILFAGDILRIWLGADFAREGTWVFRFLVVGVLINAQAHVPYSLLQGTGRPDLTAKFHTLELLIYVGLAAMLIRRLGIMGAGLAWTLRVSLDAILLFVASWRLFPRASGWFARMNIHRLAVVGYAGTVAAAMLPWVVKEAKPVKLGTGAAFVALFGLFAWHCALDGTDRALVTSLGKRFVGIMGWSRR